MPTRNTDASYITERRRAMALYAYNKQLQDKLNTGSYARPEQTSMATLDVITARKQGGCFCSDINNGNVYNNPPGTCGC
jgi:hypothetical protein